ncbi:hypothetical protein PHISP_07297 [Aspergillus sp. HF37]|nr:hypothetical protein PHISP_07297 [Aspergillus sp. HF37]
MELDRLSTEPLDQEISDQGRLSPELPIEGPQDESIPFDSTAALQHSTHAPTVPEETDTYSHCTRISREATPLERVSGNRPTVEGPRHDDDHEDQAQTDHPQPQSTENEDGNSSSISVPRGKQPVLDDYLDQLMRAQEEQETLEEGLERERLEEEFGLSHQEQPVLEPSPRPPEKQNLPLRAPDDQPAEVTHAKDTDLAQAIVAEPTQNRLPASRREGQPGTSVKNPELTASSTRDDAGNPLNQRPSADAEPPMPADAPPLPPALVEISFWSFERDEWKQSDRLRVDPSDPSPVERIARKYSWKNYSLYDRNLQSLSPAQCYRAATVDGNNAIFLISEHDEQKLAADGRLVKNRQLLSLVSRVLDRAEPEPKKRHSRSISVTSEEL